MDMLTASLLYYINISTKRGHLCLVHGLITRCACVNVSIYIYILNEAHVKLKSFQNRSGKFNMDSVEVVENDLLPLSISLNHWLPGSHVGSLLKHLQALVTMLLLESTSRQTLELSLTLAERCNFESEIISHLELGSEHLLLSFAGFPSSSALMQK